MNWAKLLGMVPDAIRLIDKLTDMISDGRHPAGISAEELIAVIDRNKIEKLAVYKAAKKRVSHERQS